ncbi:hypothetical protein GAO09_11190 [Rhizobiales bacterium RZME27]|jgi:hypothetical protein|uniref:Uncharacterized protein n=1 Tax=Endobacterium cereale TaxID=2663029 RepID=A0A6A8A9P7_9HYPH|nr:hypothetical protein [Endobacterium cereale]MEB2846678.1 hypothetical protein [Endobacterium cereale]MQY46607.1 hypothetical protein [Endobacterium cereale]
MNTHVLRSIASALLIFATLVLISAYPLAISLPTWWGHENQPVENAQVVLLFVGLVTSFWFSYRSRSAGRWFGLAVAPILLIVIGRELSWGAVLLEPTSMGEHGPLYASQCLWYKPMVAPVVTGLITLCIAVVSFTPTAKAGIRLLKHRRIPIWSLMITLTAMLVSTAAEGHLPLVPLHYVLEGGVAQLVEEIAELSAYAAMVAGLLFIMTDLDSLSRV